MNTAQTAQQLRLAATILETGHPWEHYLSEKLGWLSGTGKCPIQRLANDNVIRLVLATPPDGRPLHNPDNLDAEQVGAGYRLTLPGEEPHEKAEMWMLASKTWQQRNMDTYGSYTYRVPISVPWPEIEKPDPYAELKAAHAAGKVIQFITPAQAKANNWSKPIKLTPDGGDIAWDFPVECFRVAPEPTFQLPPPPPGMQWHRLDGWKEGDLPQGYRPLVKGEARDHTDEIWDGKWFDVTVGDLSCNVREIHCKSRTTRPLTFTHEGKTWTWHRPGDPMPCKGESQVVILMASSYPMDECVAKNVRWSKLALCDGSQAPGDVIGWRYAEPATKTVPFGPEDVPPGSVFRAATSEAWFLPTRVTVDGIHHVNIGHGVQFTYFTSLHQARYEINRPRHRDADGNPTLWEPCSKEVPV